MLTYADGIRREAAETSAVYMQNETKLLDVTSAYGQATHENEKLRRQVL